MKNLLLVTALLFLILPNIFGEIKNGYGKDIPVLRASLKALQDLLASNDQMSGPEKKQIKQKIADLTRHLIYYEVTEVLLNRFRTVSFQLYEEIDELKDAKGRSVDVYVKFLPEDSALPSYGIVSLVPSAIDTTACNSEYGAGSASIRIRTTNKALLILAHEFDHLSYIVPNLRPYLAYYKNIYRATSSIGDLGHLHGDPSGLNAYRFEKQYRLDHVNYRKQDYPKEIAPMSLVARTHRAIVEGGTEGEMRVVQAGW